MNYLDIIILIPVAYLAYRGFVNGLVREVFGIVGMILAVFLTFEYMKPVAEFLSPFFDLTDQSILITGIVIFVMVIIVVQLMAWLLERLFKLIRLGVVNKFAGFLFASLKGAIIISAILLLLAGINVPGEETREQSKMYPIVIYVAPAAYDMVASVYPGAKDFIETIERTIEENNSIRQLPIFENIDS
ncbi:MAG: CvpA family protein [Bacteroidetes bacterium]|jgi:membrane protein required for colicin V production|nr:CvpA family protein [Bacteroidota bacterium]